MTVSPFYASVAVIEIIAVLMTAFLSIFLKSDPTRSFILSLLFPITGLTLSDCWTISNELWIKSSKGFMVTLAFQFVFTNLVVLSFLFGIAVFLLTSAHTVRTKTVPRTWPAYVVISVLSSLLSVANYFSEVLRKIPARINEIVLLLAVVVMVLAMILVSEIALPYSRVRAPETLVRSTDPAVFNAKWRFFCAYIYLIVPGIRSIFVIVRTTDNLTKAGWLDPQRSSGFSSVANYIDFLSGLMFLLPAYFCLPAYRSTLFFCYKSREVNPIFFFVKVMPKGKKRSRSLIGKKNRVEGAPPAGGSRPVEFVALEEVETEEPRRKSPPSYGAVLAERTLAAGNTAQLIPPLSPMERGARRAPVTELPPLNEEAPPHALHSLSASALFPRIADIRTPRGVLPPLVETGSFATPPSPRHTLRPPPPLPPRPPRMLPPILERRQPRRLSVSYL